ncbi:2-phosphosulfolactate phosphatase [Paenibacillus sp.]|uniref:2-phosphosulfolactate phosphatase n=1 Tax=Paenibacillus sp. TaxID=58172 RepID=UPI0028128482|nr:2-phosphosulfolactate phosphatase [Paenibacillus sp.]
MRIDCISTVSETFGRDLAGKTAIVIDVLRATSAMVTALERGAKSVAPADTVASARQSAEPGDVLAGERLCKKIPGFALGLSPHEFTEEAVGGRRVVMTTTNGTRAIQKAAKAATILVGSFLNADACAKAALRLNRDVVLLCSGTKDAFALEDGLCAGMIAKRIKEEAGRRVATDDLAAAMEGAYRHFEHRLDDALLSSDTGGRLVALGYREDVVFCARRDVYRLTPVMAGGELRPFECRQGVF